jgi:hypothetical protein
MIEHALLESQRGADVPLDEDHVDEASALLASRGWCVVPGALPTELVARVREQMAPAAARRQAIRARNGVEGHNDGTLHHLVADHPAFLEVIDHLARLEPLFSRFFGGRCVLNSYGGVINVRDTRAYVHAVHRDIRFGSQDRRFMLNLLLMLDPFTADNGATYLLSGSHRQNNKPDDSHFQAHAERATGSAGSMLFFDSRLWHAAGDNQTSGPRRALTLTLTPPFFKPQMDYCRLLGEDSVRSMSPLRRQLLGFNARVPDSLDTYYVPVAERRYQRGQDE